MREIKFRGKRLDNGEWITGDLIRISGHTFILPDPAPNGIDRYMVEPATVGQYTGLKDKKDKEIYEGDILRVTLDFSEELVNREVYYLEDGFCIHIDDETAIQRIVYAVYARDAEVIGNIHDNPKLLKTE